MSDIGISGYPHLQGGHATWADYSVATTFRGADLIVFNKIPKTQFGLIESQIDKILEHETLHIVFAELDEDKSSGFDKLFPFLDSFAKLKFRKQNRLRHKK